MSISDELREFASHCAGGMGGDSLRHIADRIDTEYEKAIRELNNLADASVLLPVDADGVPIRLGDEMECGDGTVFTVESISLYPFGWRCDGDGIDGNGYKCTAHPIPECCHHHHEPTVEDVLAEFFEQVGDGLHTLEAMDTQLIIAEYAAKMRAIIEGSKGPEWQETVSQDEER